MSNFAKILNGKVIHVIVAEQEFFNTFIDSSAGYWVQTSYNTRGNAHYKPNSDNLSEDQSKSLRGNYASIGYTYDTNNNVFYAPQPFPSWILNNTTWLWEAPVAMPTDDKKYNWNESITNWEEVTL